MQLVGCLLSHFSIIVSFSVSFFIAWNFFMQSNGCLSHRASLSLELAAWTPMMSFNMFCPLYFLSLLSMEPTGNRVRFDIFGEMTPLANSPDLRYNFFLWGVAGQLFLPPGSGLYVGPHSTFSHPVTQGEEAVASGAGRFHGEGRSSRRAEPSHVDASASVWKRHVSCLHFIIQRQSHGQSLGHARNLSKPGEVTNNHEDMGVMWFVFVCSLVMLESPNHKGYKMVLFWSYHLSIFLRWVL